MKFLSFKIVILCILLPPLFYIFSAQSLERYLNARYSAEIRNIYIGDTRPLLEGNISLKDTVGKNINAYLQSKRLLAYGVKLTVNVVTKQGTVLYPLFFEEEHDLPRSDTVQTAAENYRLMNEGLVLTVDLKLGHNTLLSFAILAFYTFFSLLVFYYYYRLGIKKAGQSESEKDKEIRRLQDLERLHNERLRSLMQDREKLASESLRIKKALEDEKSRASANEDGMIEEIVKLEKRLGQNLLLQKEQQEELEALKEKITESEEKGGRKESRSKAKDADIKRFRVLYKNLSVHERAVSGFAGLSDELKIKAEEVIHQLNDNPELVTIKRKVFGKKSRQTVLEVIFAYKGRLYFKKTKDNKIEILAVGSKNTQTKDLEFLDNLPPE